MSAVELLQELRRRGVRLTVYGDRLRYEAPPGVLTPELLELMRQHKPALMALLQPPAWPPAFGRPDEWPSECLQSLRTYRVPHALLYPLVGRWVQTPGGPGRLLQVFGPLAAVALDSEPERAAVFEPHEIRPLPG